MIPRVAQSSRRPIPTRRRGVHVAALVVATLPVACGDGDTTATSGQATTGESSSGSEPTTGDPTSPGPTDDTSGHSTGDAPTGSTGTVDTMADSTGDEPSGCAALCERSIECGVPTTLDGCTADCEATPPLLRSCLLACDLSTCDGLLACTTACAEPGDPSAPPYASCEGECAPGVIVCIATSHPDGAEFSVCAPYCDPSGECPVPQTGDAVPRCDVEPDPPVCLLDCSQGELCPDGMVCDDGLCTWTVP